MHPSIACKRKSRQNRWILVYYKAISPFPWIYLSVAVGCSPYGILLIFFHRDLGLYRVMDVGRHGRGNALDNLSRIVFHQARLQTHYNFPWFPLAIHLSIEELEIVFLMIVLSEFWEIQLSLESTDAMLKMKTDHSSATKPYVLNFFGGGPKNKEYRLECPKPWRLACMSVILLVPGVLTHFNWLIFHVIFLHCTAACWACGENLIRKTNLPPKICLFFFGGYRFWVTQYLRLLTSVLEIYHLGRIERVGCA